ncbi:MAG: pantetheine-phosphate adenylyltransferase [Anaerolineae bacterium]|nr:pantetheine-phosphate adenylyltransferase [Anaerolineae bacterium]
MTRAIFPASFDPITCGHIDIATRAARIFNELIVGVYSRPQKNTLFSVAERLALTKEALAHIPNIQVQEYSTLTVEFAKACNASVIVRGLRVASDFEWELQLSLMNRTLDTDIETICFMPSQQYAFLSSSMLKDIAKNDGPLKALAPDHVIKALKIKYNLHHSNGHSNNHY